MGIHDTCTKTAKQYGTSDPTKLLDLNNTASKVFSGTTSCSDNLWLSKMKKHYFQQESTQSEKSFTE